MKREKTSSTKPQRHYYTIAELNIEVVFGGGNGLNNNLLIASFAPFEQLEAASDTLMTMVVDDTLRPIAKDSLEPIGRFDTGNGVTVVSRLVNGSEYQFIIKDIHGYDCCLLQADATFRHCRCALNGNADMRRFGLNNALMLAFSFSASFRETLLLHASTVRNNGYAYAFIAKSGTGKSTHVDLWMRHIEGCDLINDDAPVVRVAPDGVFVYGSPWSGKTACYRLAKVPMGAITRIVRANANSIERLSGTMAFASLLSSTSQMKWDKQIFDNVCDTIIHVVEHVGVYTLNCLPDKDAALLCHKVIAR